VIVVFVVIATVPGHIANCAINLAANAMCHKLGSASNFGDN